MMVQAAAAGDGQHDERRPFGGPFDPDLKIVNDFGADGICGRDNRGARERGPGKARRGVGVLAWLQ